MAKLGISVATKLNGAGAASICFYLRLNPFHEQLRTRRSHVRIVPGAPFIKMANHSWLAFFILKTAINTDR